MKKFLLLILVFPLFSLAQTINSIEHYPSINLESGWNMIGYTCLDPMNVEDALISLGDTVLIVKDNNGNVYLPEFNFNGIGQFEFGFGYQLKLSQAVFNFSFCPFLVPLVEGCTDATAFNFNPSANWDDGSCIPFLYGCTDSLAFNFDSSANSDDYSCFPVVFGCTDSASYNYNDFDSDGLPNELTGINGVDVNTDNGSCIPFIYGCTDQAAFNYNPQANTSDLNDLYCIPVITGCNIPTAYNFNDYDNDGEPNEYTGNASIDVNTYEINSCIDKVYGCIDSTALNFSIEANTDNDSCIPFIYGCTDSLAYNYSILANTDDNSCIPFVYGCTDSTALNFFNEANTDDESCIAIVYGCTDSTAFNYDIDANVEDGSCIPFIYGCTDETAYNYNPQANTSDLNDLYCIPVITGCNIPTAYNFNDYDNDGEPNEYTGNPSIDVNTYEINSCIDKSYGCTDSTALNFSIEANTDNGSCIPFIYGCTDSLAYNYSILANTDDNSCIPFVYGCTDSTAINYSLESNTDDGSCIPKVFGCMDSLACNFNPEANMSDGSCEYAELGYDCDGNFVEYVVGMEAEGGIVFYVDETGERGLVAAMEDLTEGASDNSETGLIGFEWGCFGEYVDGADGTSLGTGYLNTIDIVNQGCVVDYGGITAAQAALLFESEGYSDWYLPSIDELIEMYNTFGNLVSEVNIGGFDTSIDSGWYWSSSTFDNLSWGASFNDGAPYYGDWRNGPGNVRPIRAFGYTLGCMDSLACNFNPEANMSDGSCEYPELGYDCDGNFVEYIVGMEAEGGIVFYVDSTGERGLVLALEDIDGFYEFGCYGNWQLGGFMFFSDTVDLGMGLQNTMEIINKNCVTENGGITAAQAALDAEINTFDDWYLPSMGELDRMKNYIDQSEHNLFWSSTPHYYGGEIAFKLNLDSSIVSSEWRDSMLVVRPIRAFGYTVGCMDSLACNFNPEANMGDGSCEYPELGYDCEGNIVEYVVGMEAEGGIVFYVDETGQHGLVAAMEDLTEGATDPNGWGFYVYEWGCYFENVSGAVGEAIGTGYQNTMDIVNQGCDTENGGITAAQASLDAEINDYSDWFLPSIDELEEMYNTIGNGGPEDNIGGFETSNSPYYWSSSEYGSTEAWAVAFSNDGWTYYFNKNNTDITGRVRVVRAFGYTLGCMDSLACNYNSEANMSDGSCEYPDLGYDCDGNEITQYQVGDLVEGGIVFYVDSTGERGLVASDFDLIFELETDSINYQFQWGCYVTNLSGADETAIGTGYQNTMDIVNQGCVTENGGITAAQAAYDAVINGYIDWYLPSEDELREMYYTIGFGGSNGNIGGFFQQSYWSSSQVNEDVFAFQFQGETGIWFPRYYSARTRPIRAFGYTFGCMDSLACNFNSEANMSDGSCEYAEEGFDCEGNPNIQVGDIFEGGIVFYVDETGEHGLVAAMENLPGNYYKWGCIDENVDGADGQSIGTGYQNTMDIVNEGCINENLIAAQAALDYEINGYNDWYLPSSGEIITLYNSIGNVSPLGDVGGLGTEWYWSSSEANAEAAYRLYSGDPIALNGEIVVGTKNGSWKVRPIRAFGYTLGCMDSLACNYNPEANMSDASCEYAEQGYDCDGNEITQYQVGDLAEGGIVFYVDETGEHGLVAAMEDLPYPDSPYSFDEVLAYSYLLQNYQDWEIPNVDELILMYLTIGQGAPIGNIALFKNAHYWSSNGGLNYIWVNFTNGESGVVTNSVPYYDQPYWFRPIRAF